MPIIALTKH